MDNITSFLYWFIPLMITGGGITIIFTIRYVRKQERAKARQAEFDSEKARHEANFSQIENFEKKITAYNHMIEDLNAKINVFIQNYNALEKKFDNMNNKYITLKDKYESLQKKYNSLLRKYNNLLKKNEKIRQIEHENI